jgi:endonuclease G, mitochondrial
MLNLSKDDRKQLRKALISGFRSYSALKTFVSDSLDIRLNEIAPSTATTIAAEALIEHFEEGGKDGDISDLILALQQERPRNPEVLVLMLRLQEFLQQRLVLDPVAVEVTPFDFDLPEPYNDFQLESFLPQQLSYEADVGRLQRGLRRSTAVCKIAFSDRTTTGTGVLIAPDLVLTNYHVLSKQFQERSHLNQIAETLRFEFGCISEESDVSSNTLATAAPEAIVACSPRTQLDYALLRVEPRITRVGEIQPVPINARSQPLFSQTALNVLQHPGGEVMQVSLSASGVIKVDAGQGKVWYVNRTRGGSSGAPCFDGNWDLVALHHASIARRFGSIREGILFSSILAEISSFLV